MERAHRDSEVYLLGGYLRNSSEVCRPEAKASSANKAAAEKKPPSAAKACRCSPTCVCVCVLLLEGHDFVFLCRPPARLSQSGCCLMVGSPVRQ